MLITGIGLSSLWAMRVQRRVAGVGEAVVQARVAAGSFLDVALLRIANNPSWRSAYTHNVWITDETVDNISYTFKLVDEQDADLANDGFRVGDQSFSTWSYITSTYTERPGRKVGFYCTIKSGAGSWECRFHYSNKSLFFISGAA